MAATYELTGAGGKGKSTLKGKIAALIPFEEFLATLQQPSYEDMVEEIRRGDRSINALCDIKLFQAFATFLITTFKTQKDETPMLGTIKQYLSGVVVRVHMDFPENHIMMQTNIVGSWYSKLRSAIDYDVTKRHINAGQNVADDTNPCGRVLLKLICDALLKLGTADALKRRFIICITFCAVGRSGECALATWDSAKYDHDLNNLYMNWNDRKTSTQDPMNFFVDYSSYSICFYHSLFCNLIVHGTDKLKKSGRKVTFCYLPFYSRFIRE